MNFDRTPENNEPCLLQLQVELMTEAERLFGPRNNSKNILPPSWDEEGPHIRYTLDKNGAFAELSYNAKSDWRLATYQLAHEMVHLLDQHGGDRTHLLEEGAAVRFSLDMMKKYGFDSTGLPGLDSYKHALCLFDLLGGNPYSIARDCRSTCGSFISIDAKTLKSKCPGLDDKLVAELLRRPVMR